MRSQGSLGREGLGNVQEAGLPATQLLKEKSTPPKGVTATIERGDNKPKGGGPCVPTTWWKGAHPTS